MEVPSGARVATVYCLVAPELADELLEPLRKHYAKRPEIVVMIDLREGSRRSTRNRRTLWVTAPEVEARRSGRDRRMRAERRGPRIPRKLPGLPRRFRPHAASIRWEQRLPAVSRATEGLDLDELVVSMQAGDAEAPTEFYWRMYERAHARLRQLRGYHTNPERHMPALFGALLDAIGDFRPGSKVTFEAWFYGVVQDFANSLGHEPVPDGFVAVRQLAARAPRH